MSESVDNVIVNIDSKLRRLSREATGKPNIYKVNVRLREVNEKAYDPQIVAIGPIHRGKDYLDEMEQHKISYLHQLLQRRGEHSVKKYVVELRKMEERCRKCYSSSIKLPDTEQFVEMLLLDGCFIIELLRKYWFPDLRDENDLMIRSDQSLYPLRSDLMLVENQLPFFILSRLFEMTKLESPEDDLHYLLLCFLEIDSLMPWREDVEASYGRSVHKADDHLLGLLYITYFPIKTIAGSDDNSFVDLEEINTASELEDGGIEFKTSKEMNVMNISFKDGVMMLPKLNVEDNTEFILSNMIAYEQINASNQPNYVTDYIHLMSSLVKSGKDVELLRRAEIIRNWLDDDQAVHIMFNKLSKHTVITKECCYFDLFKSVNKHFHRRRNKWIANLKRDYFSSPWAILSVIAAIILLLLTATQTVFTVLPFIIGSPS